MARGNGDIWLKEPRKPRKRNPGEKRPATYLQHYHEICEGIAEDRRIAFENLQMMRTGAGQQLAV